MSNASLKRVALAALGGLVVAGVLVAGLSYLNGGQGFVACTATMTLGWIVPLVAGLLIGFVALLLLGSSAVQDGPMDGPTASTCSSCGKPILADWRLCPHCGQMLECELRQIPSEALRELSL